MSKRPDDEQAVIDRMARQATDWTDEDLAARIVGLLILDKGVVNAWQRTIEFAIDVVRAIDRARLTK